MSGYFLSGNATLNTPSRWLSNTRHHIYLLLSFVPLSDKPIMDQAGVPLVSGQDLKCLARTECCMPSHNPVAKECSCSTSFGQLCPGNFNVFTEITTCNTHLYRRYWALHWTPPSFSVFGHCQDVFQRCLCQGIQQCVTPHHLLALSTPEENIRSGIGGVFFMGKYFHELAWFCL